MASVLNFILLSAGIGLGLAGVFIFSQALIAGAAVLIATPLIQKLVDDMLIEEWKEVIIIFFGITGFIIVGVWALSLINEMPNAYDRFISCLSVIGAGFIQLAWMFLVTENEVLTRVECGG